MTSRRADLALRFPPTGEFVPDVDTLLAAHGQKQTREHVPRVVARARKLAKADGEFLDRARPSALLYDLGGIFERAEMVPLCLGLSGGRNGRCRCYCTPG